MATRKTKDVLEKELKDREREIKSLSLGKEVYQSAHSKISLEMSDLRAKRYQTQEAIESSLLGVTMGTAPPALEIAVGLSGVDPGLYLINMGVGTILGAVFGRSVSSSMRGAMYGGIVAAATSLGLTTITDIAQTNAYNAASTAKMKLIETEKDRSITYQTNDGNLYHNLITDQGDIIPFEEVRAADLGTYASEQAEQFKLTNESWDERQNAIKDTWYKKVKPLIEETETTPED